MRLKKILREELYVSMVDMLTDVISGVSKEGTIIECLTEIIAEEYEKAPLHKCTRAATDFFEQHYLDAYQEAWESFRRSPQEEAWADIRQETMSAEMGR